MTLQIKLIIAAVLVASLYVAHVYVVKQEVKKAEAVQLAAFNKQVLENVLRSIDTETNIKKDTKALLDKKNEDIANITRERNKLSLLLSKRPTRPTESTVITDTGSSCTGTQLYREDGEFLSGEAARADKILTERNFYYDQYEQARKKIDEFNRTK